MALALTIAGASKVWRPGSLSIAQTANGRATFSCQIVSTAGTYRPALDAEVVLTEGATTIFGGIVDRPLERGLLQGSTAGIYTEINAVDYNAYAERRYVNTTLVSTTLKLQLEALRLAYLNAYGVTLHASQVDGPTMPELVLDYIRLDDVLNRLMTITADAGEPYVWRIDASKVLRAFRPSTTAAPFNITSNATTDVRSDIEVEENLDDQANSIIVKVLPKTELNHVETFTGDGTTHTFQLAYTLLKHTGFVDVDGTLETLSEEGIGFDLAVSWLWNRTNNTIRRVQTGVNNPPANGAVITITFDGVFSGVYTAFDAADITARGIRDKLIVLDSVPDAVTGQQIADAELAKALTPAKTIRYRTFTAGVAVGQTQTVTLTRRNLSGTAVITDLVTRDVQVPSTSAYVLERHVTAIVDAAQTNLGRGWRDTYRLWAGDQAGGGMTATTSSGGGTVTTAAPGQPDTAVQFNNGGQFWGDVDFTFDVDTTSLVCGSGSSITASSPDSCQAFGYDCHITD